MQTTSEQVSSALNVETAKGAAGKIGRKLRVKKPPVPSQDEPRAELRRLVKEHKNFTRKATAIRSMASDKKNRETGEKIPCTLPKDRIAEVNAVAAAISADAKRLESAMLVELRKEPIYTDWLANVYGIGPVVAAYLVSEINVGDYNDPVTGELRSRKPSQVKRFCGLAVIDGKLERPKAREKNHYSKEMRTRIYQAMSAMYKNAAWFTVCSQHEDEKPKAQAKKEVKAAFREATANCLACQATSRPFGKTSKYLTLWADTVHREASAERKGGFKKGMWKAASLLIEDLYIVWRALLGLPVWPSYYAAMLGYEHGGKISVNAPKLITFEEAVALVGDVGGHLAERSVPVVEEDDLDEDDLAAE